MVNFWAMDKNGRFPVFFWPKKGVPSYDTDRECHWPYLIGQHPFLAKIDRVLPSFSTLHSFYPFLTILCLFQWATRTDQHGPREQ